MIIPLNSGSAFQRFSVSLSGQMVRFELRWLTRFSLFLVDIHVAGNALVQGRALLPGQDLLEGVITDLGTITLEGDPATVANLGQSNRLVYVP